MEYHSSPSRHKIDHRWEYLLGPSKVLKKMHFVVIGISLLYVRTYFFTLPGITVEGSGKED